MAAWEPLTGVEAARTREIGSTALEAESEFLNPNVIPHEGQRPEMRDPGGEGTPVLDPLGPGSFPGPRPGSGRDDGEGIAVGDSRPATPVAALVFPALDSADNPTDLFTPFELAGPDRPLTPLVFASPHSGRIYPVLMMSASRLGADTIRRSEDVWVDQLIAGAAAVGARLINARLARVYFDVNREPWELDPAMFSDELPAYARGRTPRVAAGLGAIARIVAEGEEVYARKLTFAEARARVEAVHAPYHAALRKLTEAAVEAHGLCVLIDWHSMPSAAARHAAGGACDVVLGDRFGGACSPGIARAVERGLSSLGYRVVRNAPYAGGYTTEHYGRPAKGVHALQIEVNRALYVDEAMLTPTAGFARLKGDLERLFEGLAETNWGLV